VKIFITGGSGSLGMALLAHYERQGHTCTVYSRDEVKQSDARRIHPEHRFVLGDVRNREWLEICMRGHDLVVHAAAYKQIPSSEANVGEAIETNVVGSRNVAMAAVSSGVGRVVGVSTDKACEPVNAYGATKALMEKLFQQANTWVSDGGTTFTLVRYGNVLHSRGSVVPLLRLQAEKGQRLTITDEHMTRFWLTMDEAVSLIAIASMLTTPGVILVPKAKASTMLTMAMAVWQTYCGFDALTPGFAESHYTTIGIRAGEKLHEKLVHSGESMHAAVTPTGIIIHPPQSEIRNQSGLEYSSDRAEQLSVAELSAKLVAP
jgi:UDP-N-acetylglucosamine 4,6-dehydratase